MRDQNAKLLNREMLSLKREDKNRDETKEAALKIGNEGYAKS